MSQYNHQEIELKILEFWRKEKIYKFNEKRDKIYSIDTPPPTVSGKMHMGHAYSYSQQDFIARFRKMKENVFYPFGTDDNGLPTERLVEKLKKVKSKEMSRSDFIKLCLQTLKEITPDFIQDWKNLGISCDFDIYYSTIDDNSRKISQSSFIELYKKGLVYKKEFPTLWCPECQTAIAQAELEDKEPESFFSTLMFSCDNKDLFIATTRPEMLEACRAVFVHPKDKRYKDLIGKKAKVPLFNFEVPVIADESADPEKGTGVLMVCSYGDKFDSDAIKRHMLESKIILGKNGIIKEGRYKGLKVKDAREKILEELEKNNLVKEKKIIKHVVNVHDKCGTEIEFLPTEQWFINLLDNKNKFIELGKKIHWYPNYMFKRYENWVNGLEWDWSISRDRHFGIPIPVWECKDCKEIILAEQKELPIDPLEVKKICKKCKKEANGEERVLDTWATSSLTPQIASSLIKNKIENFEKIRVTKFSKKDFVKISLGNRNYAKFSIKMPYSLRPQAHDIIRTWAFYTIVKSFYHKNKIPWNDVIISGYATLKGKKMSKSKGNIVEPQEVLKKYGADALRYWAAGPKLGEDLEYQEKDLIAGKKLLTKLWNATNFIFINLKDYDFKKPKKLEKIDELLLIKLNGLIKNCTEYFENYDYSKAKQLTDNFFWNIFCDNYLEIIKKRIYNEKGDKKKSAQYTLYKSLLTLLKLFAPIIPFITENIYQEYFRKREKEKSIHLTKWPKAEKIKKSTEELDFFLEILSKVRQEKSAQKKPMNAEIILFLEKKEKNKIKELLDDLKNVSNAKEIKEGEFKVDIL